MRREGRASSIVKMESFDLAPPLTSKAKGVKLVCSLYVIPLDEDLDLVDREPSCLSGYSYKTQTKEEEVKLDHAVHQFSPRGAGMGAGLK